MERAVLLGGCMKIAALLACSLGMVGCVAGGDSDQNPGGGKGDYADDALAFDFDFRSGENHGFEAIFRDVYTDVHAEYLRRKTGGLDLGPVAPLRQPLVEIPADSTHWMMHDGILPLPEGLDGKGLLVQGTNRSDDMDMYIVKPLGERDGLEPNTSYRVRFRLLQLAGEAPRGAFGVGGAPDLKISGVATTTDPMPFIVVDSHIRHPANVMDVRGVVLGTNGVCMIEGAADVPGVPRCPTGNAPIPFTLNTFTPGDDAAITIKTDADARLWIMVGGHSGFEGFTGIYYTRVAFDIEAL